MRYVAAYLLAVLGGASEPSAENINTILSSVGIEADKDRVEKVIAALKGKDVNALIAEGKGKLAAIGPAVGSAPSTGSAPAKAEEKKEDKKEDKKDDKKKKDDDDEEEADMGGGFGLFGEEEGY